MRFVVNFQGEGLEFEVPEDRVVANWRGPTGLEPSAVAGAVAEALENPRDFPPFRRMIVPGDQVAIALDPEVPSSREVFAAIADVLGASGVESETLTVVTPTNGNGNGNGAWGERAATVEVHDPDDRERIAYLASTRQGRRVYLNRALTDADVVVPVGLLRFDEDFGYRGPWSLLYPGLSDRPTLRAMREGAGPDRARREARLEEATEVGWLLGSQFSLGIVPAASGVLEVVAGRDAAVRAEGIAALERNWSLVAPSRAELVIAGVGGTAAPATLEDLAAALETSTALVRRGGRIVVLSRAAGAAGPALQRLAAAGDPGEAADALRGLEDAEDYPIARRIARAAAWADLFVASGLDADLLEGLTIAPLERPEQARRLAAAAESVTFVSHAELTRATVEGE